MTNPSTIKQITYASEIKGPSLLVLGGVHGNETCGPIACRRVLEEFESGALKLARGQVTFVPVCNPEAARLGVRFVERNLNRFLVPMENPDTYEARLGNILCPLLERCDVLVDLHSYTGGDDPFIFVDQTEDPIERMFARLLGDWTLMTGFAQAYANAGRTPPENPNEPIGTREYARRHGAYGVTLECGQHKAIEAPEIAYAAIHNALAGLGLIDAPKPPAADSKLVTVEHVYFRTGEGQFAKRWKNLSPVSEGEEIARYDTGESLRAPKDGFVILPDEHTPIGTEWYYFGAA